MLYLGNEEEERGEDRKRRSDDKRAPIVIQRAPQGKPQFLDFPHDNGSRQHDMAMRNLIVAT